MKRSKNLNLKRKISLNLDLIEVQFLKKNLKVILLDQNKQIRQTLEVLNNLIGVSKEGYSKLTIT